MNNSAKYVLWSQRSSLQRNPTPLWQSEARTSVTCAAAGAASPPQAASGTTSASCPPGREDTGELLPCLRRPLSQARKRSVQGRGHQQCAAAFHSHKSQKLQAFVNICCVWGLVFCLFSFFFDNKTCGIFSVGDLDLTFLLSALPRSVSKRCLRPSLSSVMVCDFKGFHG